MPDTNIDSQLVREEAAEALELLGVIYKDRVEEMIDAQIAGAGYPVLVKFYSDSQVELVAAALLRARTRGQLDIVDVIQEHATKLEGDQALVADEISEAVGRKLMTLDRRYGL